MLNQNTLDKVQWESVHFAEISEIPKIWSTTSKIVEFNLAENENKESFIEKVIKVLNFPDWCGRNWSAINDLLTDEDFTQNTQGLVLVIKNTQKVWQKDPALLGIFSEIWLSSAEFWSKEQKPFHLVFVLN